MEACSSLQRCFVAELLMVSAFTGWLGKSPFPPSDTRQWWLRSQGREQPKESHSEQLPCKAKEPQCLFSLMRAVTHISCCRHRSVFMQSHQHGAGTAARRTSGPHADPDMAPCVGVLSHAWSRTSRRRRGLGNVPDICAYAVLGVRLLSAGCC